MSIETISAPDLGVEQAQVIEIMVAVGDMVSADDNILLVESDKASLEIPAGQHGTVTDILVANGDTITQGSVLVKLDTSATSASAAQNPSSQPESASLKNPVLENLTLDEHATTNHSVSTHQPIQEVMNQAPSNQTPSNQTTSSTETFTIPDLGVEKAEVIDIMVQVGDLVLENDNIMLLESDKATMEVPTPKAGKIVAIHVSVGDSVLAGADFITVKVTETAKTPPTKNAEPHKAELHTKHAETQKIHAQHSADTVPPSIQINDTKTQNVYAGPAVRKLCRELGVDITQVTGSAVNGRIVKEDVHTFVKNKLSDPTPTTEVASSAVVNSLPPLPDMSGNAWGATHEEPLTNLQKVSIPQLTYNTLIPQVTQFDLADITDTENYRKSVKDALKKEGVSLTIVAFAIKAVAYALRKHPKFNSHLSDDHSKLIIRDEVHIGMAVATDHGLIVPVIRHADQKGLIQIASELKELASKARDKKLGMQALTGAGFSISSQGNMGGTYFTPLVNVPQVAILGISEATIQPRWNATKQTFEPRLMLPLSLSYDHRVINGADAAVFTRYLARLLEDVRQVIM